MGNSNTIVKHETNINDFFEKYLSIGKIVQIDEIRSIYDLRYIICNYCSCVYLNDFNSKTTEDFNASQKIMVKAIREKFIFELSKLPGLIYSIECKIKDIPDNSVRVLELKNLIENENNKIKDNGYNIENANFLLNEYAPLVQLQASLKKLIDKKYVYNVQMANINLFLKLTDYLDKNAKYSCPTFLPIEEKLSNYKKWVDDLEKGNIIVLKFPSENLTVSKTVLLRRCEVIRNFMSQANKGNKECVEYPVPINFSKEEIKSLKMYLLESDGNLKDLEIIKYLRIE